MIKPSRHFAYNKSALYLSGCALDIIRKHKVIGFSELVIKMEDRYRIPKGINEVNSNLLPALDLLYMLGAIEYFSQNDSFVYLDDKCR
ncbi:MAG: hypothetical protein Q8M98_04435 [Candidatus Cloacimonadaceae bacterium]|nr:hypothetical protein [Candidatus Cloacimonadaceae bacterium]